MKLHLVVSVLTLIVSAPAFAAEPPPEWITSRSVAGIYVKLGDLWKTKPGQKLLEVLAKHDAGGDGGLERVLGVQPKEVDRLALVAVQFGPRFEEGLILHVTTAAPFDRTRLLKNLQATPNAGNPEPPLSRAKQTFSLPDHAMMFVGGDRSYAVMFAEDAVLLLLERLLSAAATPNRDRALEDKFEKHIITAWVRGRQLSREIGEQIPTELQALRDVQELVLTGDIADESAQLSLHLQFPRNGLAADGLRALEEGRQMARDGLGKLEKELGQDAKGNAAIIELFRELQKTVAAARFRHSNTQVTGSASVQLAPPLQAAFVDGVGYLQMRANRVKSINNIKQISLAFHNYESAYGNLPPAAVCDKNGKALLSWRVAILPFIEQEILFRQFKMDEAWDSEHNKKLIANMPEIYRLPGDRKRHDLPSTHYQVFVGGNAVFQLTRGGRIAEIADGTSNTIWLTEAATAVPWSKPGDLNYDPAQLPKVGYHYGDRFNAGFADGSVRSLRKNLKPEILHLLIQKNDGQVIPPFDD